MKTRVTAILLAVVMLFGGGAIGLPTPALEATPAEAATWQCRDYYSSVVYISYNKRIYSRWLGNSNYRYSNGYLYYTAKRRNYVQVKSGSYWKTAYSYVGYYSCRKPYRAGG